MSRQTHQTHQARLPAPSRLLLILVATGAAALGLLVLVQGVQRALTVPDRSTVTVNDMTLVNAQTPSFTERLPGLQANYSAVNLRISDPPSSMLWLDYAQQASGAAGTLALCALLAWLCLATLRGRPFATTAPWVLLASGLAVIASSITSDVLAGRLQGAVVDLYGIDSTGGGTAEGGSYEGFGVGTTVLLDGLGLALVLCVLGAAFALGNRLQRENDRLI